MESMISTLQYRHLLHRPWRTGHLYPLATPIRRVDYSAKVILWDLRRRSTDIRM